jgi:vacuolar-type H+-ATPase subunit H
MLAEAKREAERIVKEARERQNELVSEQEVTKQAERAAEDIIEDARAREREIRLGAEDYADEILNTLEVNLSKFIGAVQRGRDRLQGKDEPAEVS